MSTFLSKLVIKSITRVVKNTSKFDIVVDDLIDKFKDSCPPKPELLRLVAQKNQIQSALSNLTDSINTLQTTADTTENIISVVSTAVKVIKAIPVPVSVPPGVGIPINVVTILADSLDALGKLLDGAKGTVTIVPTAVNVIQTSLTNIVTKLNQLDIAVNACIEELADGLDQQGKNELINEIGNAAATSGDFSNLELNTLNEDELISQLSPNSSNPLMYKRFTLTIEFNTSNDFSFPQRRVKAFRPRQTEIRAATINERIYFNLGGQNPQVEDTYPQQTFWNLPDSGYSYSTSVKVLINEVKFRIDQEARLKPYTSQLDVKTTATLTNALVVPRFTTAPAPSGGNNTSGGSTGGASGGGGGGGGQQEYLDGEGMLGNTNNNFNQL